MTCKAAREKYQGSKSERAQLFDMLASPKELGIQLSSKPKPS